MEECKLRVAVEFDGEIYVSKFSNTQSCDGCDLNAHSLVKCNQLCQALDHINDKGWWIFEKVKT